jgi:hypothetical protein
MVSSSPTDALGRHAAGVRELLVDIIRSRHDRSAEAHVASGSRYSMGFGSQWRDLLVDAQEALAGRGYQSHKVSPAGYELPVVNGSLVYVWRVPSTPDAVSRFASSPTRRNGFGAQPPEPMLFDPGFGAESEVEAADEAERAKVEQAQIERVMRTVGDTMSVVLVMVHSSPRQLRVIEWAVAELDETSEKVELHGHEVIWKPEVEVGGAASEVESFDSGTPVEPAVGPQVPAGAGSDA